MECHRNRLKMNFWNLRRHHLLQIVEKLNVKMLKGFSCLNFALFCKLIQKFSNNWNQRFFFFNLRNRPMVIHLFGEKISRAFLNGNLFRFFVLKKASKTLNESAMHFFYIIFFIISTQVNPTKLKQVNKGFQAKKPCHALFAGFTNMRSHSSQLHF